MLARLLILLFITYTPFVMAVELDPITEETGCYPEDGAGEFGWNLLDKEGNKECVFAQFPSGKPENPYVIVKGKKVLLTSVSVKKIKSGWWQEERVFANRAKKITARLKSRLSKDSCIGNDGSCCGQEYGGRLEVSNGDSKKVYEVTRWSGA